jgi:hypothetical protein
MATDLRIPWTDMEPGKRRRWALVLLVEALVVCGVSAWVLARVVEDDGPVWICFGLTAAWFASWVVCLAVRPTAVRRVATVSGGIVGVLLLALAYLTAR